MKDSTRQDDDLEQQKIDEGMESIDPTGIGGLDHADQKIDLDDLDIEGLEESMSSED
ncbi:MULTISPECIES: hypothetical protein [Reichenbachiella]|uniref:Uncharacterized protein n=1 Tax=Reichenbachiella agariperforans TaxID=156994 RepID=A0A1M6SX28_REIAG|nr:MULTISPECIES: hypothetical protein [Reichenbachiella]MBU2916308.1 hypothetical protein [Reichenbachiella agariperforans]SHK49236.1 hypothetical protein SAMN04488028_105189 [Reichenbachiella agariperforans]